MLPSKYDIPKSESQALTVSGASPVDVNDEFWELWKENEGFLLNLCLRWMRGNQQEAREMLSAGMMRAYERGGSRVGMMGNPRAWLAQVVRSFIIDSFLAQKRSPAFFVDPEYLIFKMDEQWPGHELSPERNYVVDESYHHLQSLIEGLPDRLRSVMILRAYQNMPYKQIALHLEISPENARKRGQEAKAMVQARLDNPERGNWRGNRVVDPSGNGPRSERKAADDTLRRDIHGGNPLPQIWAEPVCVNLKGGMKIELPVFHPHRPRRLEQRQEATLKYIERHPKGYKKREDHARLLHAKGDWEKAIKEGKTALERNPQHLMLRLDLADWCRVVGQLESARELLEEGVAFTASKAWAAHLWAQLFALKGVGEEAEYHFEQACRLQPEVIRHRLARNAFWWENLNHLAIRKEGEYWLRKKGRDRQMCEWLRLALVQLGDQNACLELDGNLEQWFPEDPLVCARRIWRSLESMGGKAKKEIGRFGKRYPDSVLLLQLKMRFHFLRGETGKLKALAEKASLAATIGIHFNLPGQARVAMNEALPALTMSLYLGQETPLS